jgi:hypothetical protein
MVFFFLVKKKRCYDIILLYKGDNLFWFFLGDNDPLYFTCNGYELNDQNLMLLYYK